MAKSRIVETVMGLRLRWLLRLNARRNFDFSKLSATFTHPIITAMKSLFHIQAFFSLVLLFTFSVNMNNTFAQTLVDSSVYDLHVTGNNFNLDLNHVKLDRTLDTLVSRTDLLRGDAEASKATTDSLRATSDSLVIAVAGNDTELDSIFARADSIINVLYWNEADGVLSHDAAIDSVDVDGVFQVNGNTDLNDSLDVALNANFQLEAHVGDSLVVAGNTDLNGTLDVTGATGVDGSFDVNTNKFTVDATTGNTAVAGTLGVTGAATLSSSLDVTGATGVDGDFDINTNKFTVASSTGNTAIAGTLDVTGATGVDGDFDVASTMFTVASGTGNTAIAGTLGVTGVATLATVDINGGSIDGTAIGASTPSTVGATTIDASGDVTFNGDNFLSYSETSIHNNLKVLDNTIGTTTQFSVNEVNGNTMIAGALDMTNFDVDAAGNLDLDANLDMDGTTADFQASGAISLDAGAASNFTTTAGLTLEGGAGVTVTSTGGSMTLNGTGQTIDLDAATLDVDATTITVDATTTTFTGDVKGPRSTGDDEFVTYAQLDSVATVAPFHKSIKVQKLDNGTQYVNQSFSEGSSNNVVMLKTNYSNTSWPTIGSVNSTKSQEVIIENALTGSSLYEIQGQTQLSVRDSGMYNLQLNMELESFNLNSFATVRIMANEGSTSNAVLTMAQPLWGSFVENTFLSGAILVKVEAGTTFTIEVDVANLVDADANDIEVVSYNFAISRVGEH